MDKRSNREQFGYGVLMVRRSVFLLAALLLTVSCGGEQKGAAPPPPVDSSTKPTASPTPTATPFVSSADEAGAFAFVRHYFVQLNAAVRTGNVRALQPLRKSSCSCLKLERDITAVYGSGGRVAGSQLSIKQLLMGQSGPAFAKVTAKFSTSPGSTVTSDGQASPVPAVHGFQYVTLVREGDHWLVDDISTQQVTT